MDEIAAFFERYRARWEATRDGKVIAEFYHAPCSTLRADGSFVVLQTAMDIASFFQTAADNYHRQGCERWSIKDFFATPLGARGAVVTVNWQPAKADGTLLRDWRTSYNLIRFGRDWKIVLATMHIDA
jgi:hypothetical protein